MQVCEVIYGSERGTQVQTFLEGAMGQPCPCRQGQPCPLMPRARESAELEPLPDALHGVE